jgi:CubicO group peptidase (beta-lactamase class C family)
MRSIVVVHEGPIVGETYGEGFNASTPILGWSMTKTVNATLAGMVIKDGKLSLDQKNLFPQWAADARAEISVADLMAMTSGLEWNEDQGNFPDPGPLENLARDAAAFARDRPLVTPPGAKFNYSGGSSVLLARLWQNAIGAEARAYPQKRLFKPLGMTSAVLESDPSGTFLGEAPMRMIGRASANSCAWAENGTANSSCRASPITCVRPCRRPTRDMARSTVAEGFGWRGAKDSTSPTTLSCCKGTSAR